MKCRRCKAPAVVGLPSHNTAFCAPCFLRFFSGQVGTAIRKQELFTREDRVLVALSGGKDSLALMLELGEQGYDVTGLHVDLAIPGSSEKARIKVEDFCAEHGFSLIVVDLDKEGLPIPEIKARIRRPICSVCGKVKRHYFNKVASEGGFTAMATGHNLDDEVARLFANTLRWDNSYLSDQGPCLAAEEGFVRKVKPLYRLSEFETANYAFLKGIEIHSEPCPYSQGASFTGHKRIWDDIEHKSPGSKIAFYDGFLKRGRPAFAAVAEKEGFELKPCASCGSPTSMELCGVCRVRNRLAEIAAAENDPDNDPANK